MKYHLLKRKNKDRRTGKIINVYYVGYLRPSGKGYVKMKSTGIKAGTKEAERQADRLAQKWLQEGLPSTSKENLRTYLLDFWNKEKSEYLRSKEAETGRTYSPQYLYNNRLLIEDYFLPYFEERNILTIADLNHKNLLEWRNALLSGEIVPPKKRQNSPRKEANKISPVTVNKVRQAVWVALGWAVDMGMLPSHPGIRVKRVSERSQQQAAREARAEAVLEIAEAKRLFNYDLWKSNYSDDFVSYAAALFCFCTGARISEARGLLFKEIDLDHGFCDIVKAYTDETGLKAPKWESVRKGVPIPDQAIEAIQMVISRYPHPNPTDDDFVFPNINSRSRPATASSLSGGLKRALTRAGIEKKVRFHDLRHTFVSHALYMLPSKSVQSIVGHKSLEMTEGVYSHETEKDRQAITAFVQTLLR